MRYIADLHIHSRFSVATSKKLVPEYLEYWARVKGIHVIGTGDCIHPGWVGELREKLEPAGNGLYTLREEYRLEESKQLRGGAVPDQVFFMLTGEVSGIYKRGGRVRKVHNLCLFPDFEALESVQFRLDQVGNIRSDGRPILGLDSRHLLEMVLESSDLSFVIPAHIWTPWFSALGSKSGFDTLEECYGDLTGHIFAVETGLSSDPPMNRACSFIDPFTLVSNSDAHSPDKLGREANLFDTDLDYQSLYNSLKSGKGFLGTVEFFPQEGKYHYDGHRKCGVRWDPLETITRGGICPECGKPVTKGVMYRVAELADRSEPEIRARTGDFYSITPLPDLLAEIAGQKNSRGKTVQREYLRLIGKVGPEFHLLLYADTDELAAAGGELLALGIERLRKGQVIIEEGFDGEFGRVRVYEEGEIGELSGTGLFQSAVPGGIDTGSAKVNGERVSVRFDIAEFRKQADVSGIGAPGGEIATPGDRGEAGLSREQLNVLEHMGPALVIAGPGTGKTRLLAERIARTVARGSGSSGAVLVVTFSNRAADEIRSRLTGKIKNRGVAVETFHSLGMGILREQCDRLNRTASFAILDRDEARAVLSSLVKDRKKTNRIMESIERHKQGLDDGNPPEYYHEYSASLTELNCFDLSDLVYQAVVLLEGEPVLKELYRTRYSWLMIDEFQDINPIQYRFTRLLAGEGGRNLFVIGDPDQAIYGFRGSSSGFFDNLSNDFSEMTLFRLSRSFRCPSPVLTASGQVLHREDFLEGEESDVKIDIREFETCRSEADWIAAQIESLVGGVRSFSMDSGMSDGTAAGEGISFSDFGVLCRAAFMFEPLEEAFRNHGIPCQIAGTEPFYRAEPYRAVLTVFKEVWSGIDSAITEKEHGGLDILMMREIFSTGIRIRETVSLLLERVLSHLNASPGEVKKMSIFAARYGSDYNGFFSSIATRRGTDDIELNVEAVSLLTIHASKGLEFPYVFIPGCEERILPFELFGKKDSGELKEEERLFYVGATRTKERLWFSHARKRNYGTMALAQGRSPFLSRIEERLVSLEKRECRIKPRDDRGQLTLFS